MPGAACVRDSASVHVTMTTVFLIYDPHLRPGCRFVGGAEGGEASGGRGREGGQKSNRAIPR